MEWWRDQAPGALECLRKLPPRGHPLRPRRIKVADTYTGEFYCVKCKTKREATGAVSVNDKGTRVAKAQCPECKTNLTRFLPKA